MKIDVWLDVVCPWCYIGKRRLETALSQFEHRDQVEMRLHSFQLDPDLPRKAEGTLFDHMTQKVGLNPRQVTEQVTTVTALAAREGLDYHLEKALLVNTFDAHRMIHLAEKHGVANAMEELLFQAYAVEGISVAEIDTLVKLASEVGLDPEEVRAALESNSYADEVRADLKEARTVGVTGVPFFVIDEKYSLSGAQSAGHFLQALKQAWAESHPLIPIGGESPEAGVCNDGSCTLEQRGA